MLRTVETKTLFYKCIVGIQGIMDKMSLFICACLWPPLNGLFITHYLSSAINANPAKCQQSPLGNDNKLWKECFVRHIKRSGYQCRF